MKRYLLWLLVLCMLLGLGCGKSEEAKAADQLILDVGTVTENSKAAIEKAEKAVDALSEKDRGSLDNLEKLKSARTEYEQILAEKQRQAEEKQRQEDMEAAQVAIDAINEIGTLAYDSGEKIEAARNAYDSLEAHQQAYVTNLDTLIYDEEHLSEVKIAAAIELIDKLGEVVYPDSSELKPIQAVYKLMSAEEKAKVTNSAKYQEQIDNYNRGLAKSMVKNVKLRVKKYGDSRIEVFLDFINASDKTIKYLRFYVRFKNAVGDVLKYKSQYDFVACEDTGPYAPGKGSVNSSDCWTFYSYQIDVYNISSYELIYLECEYTDGTKKYLTEDSIKFLHE